LFGVALAVPALGGAGAAAEPAEPAAGGKAVFRIRQVIPIDGLSRGERLLNSRPPLRAGDVFTAELVGAPGAPAVIVAGSVSAVTPPGRFGRPGKITVQFAWPTGGRWRGDVEDQRFTSAQRRRMIASLFLLEGAALGASVGAQFDRASSAATLAGGGAGLLLGVAYASVQPGRPASLEPGDRLAVVVGTTCVRKIPPEAPLTVYPAHEAEEKEHKHRGKKHPEVKPPAGTRPEAMHTEGKP
jgi:hypothetical protein